MYNVSKDVVVLVTTLWRHNNNHSLGLFEKMINNDNVPHKLLPTRYLYHVFVHIKVHLHWAKATFFLWSLVLFHMNIKLDAVDVAWTKANFFLWSLKLFNVSIKLDSLWNPWKWCRFRFRINIMSLKVHSHWAKANSFLDLCHCSIWTLN